MMFPKKLIVFILFACVCKLGNAYENYKIEVTSELNEELVLKLRLTNLGGKPIRYNLAALSGDKIRFQLKNKSGDRVWLHQMFVMASYPPYYRLLNPGGYIERTSSLTERYPTIKEALKTQSLVINWSNTFHITNAKSTVKDKLFFDYKSANRQSMNAGGSYTIDKTED